MQGLLRFYVDYIYANFLNLIGIFTIFPLDEWIILLFGKTNDPLTLWGEYLIPGLNSIVWPIC